VTYTLQETSAHLVIMRSDGVLVFILAKTDRAFAEKILVRLSAGPQVVLSSP
jgi:hypothetical protein